MKLRVTADGSDRAKDGLATFTIESNELPQTYTLDLPYRDVYRRFGRPDPKFLDFAVVSSLCYVIDKVVPRSTAEDNWTRTLEVNFAVSDATAWQPAKEPLDRALSFLSGDTWSTSFRNSRPRVFQTPERVRAVAPEREQYDAACLFSGGLDSLAGAVRLLEEGRSLILVGHYDSPGPKSQQKRLFANLKERYGDRVELRSVRASQKPSASAERTLRSRSIAFIGLGLLVASAVGEGVPLYTCENGLIALNPPLTPSRAGSCSTRTMHPHYLDLLREALTALGISNAIQNPYGFSTKGECIRDCGTVPFLKTLLPLSASCSHGSRKTYWERKEERENCGYCVPCLYRRASLHASQLDRGSDYGIDICRTNEFKLDSASLTTYDVKALCSFLQRMRSPEIIRREITRNSSLSDLDAYVAMVDRGLEELRVWFREKGTAKLRQLAGV